MTNARPFWASNLQDLSIDIKNAPRQGDLTPQIVFGVFESPGGLHFPTFGSVSCILTLSPKVGLRHYLLVTTMAILPTKLVSATFLMRISFVIIVGKRDIRKLFVLPSSKNGSNFDYRDKIC